VYFVDRIVLKWTELRSLSDITRLIVLSELMDLPRYYHGNDRSLKDTAWTVGLKHSAVHLHLSPHTGSNVPTSLVTMVTDRTSAIVFVAIATACIKLEIANT